MRAMNPPPNKASTLFAYGSGLLLLGFAAILFNPEVGQIGLYWKGKSGLIAAGTGGVLALVFGCFAKQGKTWAHWAGVILAFLFLCIAFNNGFRTAYALSKGTVESYHWFKATLFGLIAFLSLAALLPLAVYMRRERF